MPAVAVVLETIEAQPLARLAPATTWLPFIWSTPSPHLNGTAPRAGVKVAVDVSVAWDLHPMVELQPLGAEAKAGSSSERGESGWRFTPVESTTFSAGMPSPQSSMGLSNRTNRKGKVPPLPLLIHDDQADL